MSTKILKLLTGISAIAVAGLLSLVPAKTTQASVPQNAPSSVPSGTSSSANRIEVLDCRPTPGNDCSPSPVSTYGSITWTHDTGSSIPPIASGDPYSFKFRINSNNSQTVDASIRLIGRPYYACYGTASFTFTYNNVEYSGLINLSNPGNSQSAYTSGIQTDDFRTVIPPSPSASAEPTASVDPAASTQPSASADPAASTQPSASADPAASTQPSASADPAASTQPGASTDPTVPTVPSGAPLSDEEAAARAFAQAITETVNEIEHASEGQVLTCKGSGALSYRILSALAKTKGVTLIYSFEYKGIIFQSTITSELAAQAFSPDIEWYGPCFLAEHFPTIITGVRM